MEIIHVMNTARSAVMEIKDGGRYYTKKPYRVLVNGEEKLIRGAIARAGETYVLLAEKYEAYM